MSPLVYSAPDRVPWDPARWPDFTAGEIACRHCGEVRLDETAMDAIQRLRTALGAPLRIASGHRCALHNARVGGAPLSRHRQLAFDVILAGHDPARLYREAIRAGFSGFGLGAGFLHLDTRAAPARWFYGERSERLWNGWLA